MVMVCWWCDTIAMYLFMVVLITIGITNLYPLTCEDRRDMSFAIAIALSPGYAFSAYLYFTTWTLISGMAFGAYQTYYAYLILRMLLPCKGKD